MPRLSSRLAEVARIVSSRTSVMAVMRNGTVRTCGEVPKLFTGGERVFPGVSTPIVVEGLANIVDIGAGPDGGYALTREGRVYAWGSNSRGELARRTGRCGSGARKPRRKASSVYAATSGSR